MLQINTHNYHIFIYWPRYISLYITFIYYVVGTPLKGYIPHRERGIKSKVNFQKMNGIKSFHKAFQIEQKTNEMQLN